MIRGVVSLCIWLLGFSADMHGQALNYLTNQKVAPLEISKLGDGIYWAKGLWGSNVGFCAWNNEVLVVDSKATGEATQKVIDEIARIAPHPITRVVYTHSDPDSFNGRTAYPDKAVVICSLGALDDYRKNKTVYLEMNAPAKIYGSWPRSDFVPEITFSGQVDIRIGRDHVTLLHYGPAHTSGDLVVWFPSERVAFIGDLVFPGREPMIQDQKGGNSFGLVRVLSILLSLKPEIRTYIPSHGDPIRSDEVRRCLLSIEDVHAKVKVMFDAGKSLDEVKKAFGVKEAQLKAGEWLWPSLAATVYRELSEKRH